MAQTVFELIDKATQNNVGWVSWRLTSSRKNPRRFSKVAIFDNATTTLKSAEVLEQMQSWLSDKNYTAIAKTL